MARDYCETLWLIGMWGPSCCPASCYWCSVAARGLQREGESLLLSVEAYSGVAGSIVEAVRTPSGQVAISERK